MIANPPIRTKDICKGAAGTGALGPASALPMGATLSALGSTALSGNEIPARVLLAPWGNVESTNGSFVLDEESGRLAVAAFEEHGTDLPIDYEHQTLGGTYSSPTGQAPAAGWIKRLVTEPGVGLMADIEWTDHARELLGSKQYRYLSPVAIIRKADRKMVALHSAALTNKPAIVGMKPIVNRDESLDLIAESQRRISHLCAPLQLGVDTDALTVLRAELDLPMHAEPEEVLLAASERLTTLRRDAGVRHVAERVHEALRAGKLVEAQRAWAEALIAREEDLFDEWLRTAPVMVLTGRLSPPGAREGKDRHPHALTARARAEFRANRILQTITTEDAYVADELRMANSE